MPRLCLQSKLLHVLQYILMQNAESTQHDLQLNYPFFVIHARHPKMNMLHISSRDS